MGVVTGLKLGELDFESIKKPRSWEETGFLVVMDGIEPPTQGFSVLCSTN